MEDAVRCWKCLRIKLTMLLGIVFIVVGCGVALLFGKGFAVTSIGWLLALIGFGAINIADQMRFWSLHLFLYGPDHPPLTEDQRW